MNLSSVSACRMARRASVLAVSVAEMFLYVPAHSSIIRATKAAAVHTTLSETKRYAKKYQSRSAVFHIIAVYAVHIFRAEQMLNIVQNAANLSATHISEISSAVNSAGPKKKSVSVTASQRNLNPQSQPFTGWLFFSFSKPSAPQPRKPFGNRARMRQIHK